MIIGIIFFMEKSKVLFNEKCAICNFEIKHYKKRSELQFQDCSGMEDKYLKKLHVVLEDGTELFIDKATLLISVSFNLISNSSAESTVISESTDHAFPRASGF